MLSRHPVIACARLRVATTRRRPLSSNGRARAPSLEKGRFVWPSPANGKVVISPAQLGMLAPGISVSSTICCLSAQLQRRRHSTVITSARCIVLEVRLSLLLERGHPGRPRSRRTYRAVTVQCLLWQILRSPRQVLSLRNKSKLGGRLARSRFAALLYVPRRRTDTCSPLRLLRPPGTRYGSRISPQRGDKPRD